MGVASRDWITEGILDHRPLKALSMDLSQNWHLPQHCCQSSPVLYQGSEDSLKLNQGSWPKA